MDDILTEDQPVSYTYDEEEFCPEVTDEEEDELEGQEEEEEDVSF